MQDNLLFVQFEWWRLMAWKHLRLLDNKMILNEGMFQRRLSVSLSMKRSLKDQSFTCEDNTSTSRW